MNVADFDAIRPWNDEELPQVYDRLLDNPQFVTALQYVLPGMPLEKVRQTMYNCHSSLEFQKTFCYQIVQNIVRKMSEGYTFDFKALDTNRRYTFISNHRDIVMDSALLDVILVDAGFSTTCEIAIGDNLLKLPWIKDLVRLNKSFIVERGLPMRQMLMASKRLSEYMHYAISEKHENIWIAQREGRAKDSNDRTQKAILQMMAMGGEGNVVERLMQLHLVPLSISYEYDPCDVYKAKEFQQKRDDPNWKKGPMDDVVSMKTGITGYKGHIHYHASPCLDDYLLTLDANAPKGELFTRIAAYIDRQIHANYWLYPVNYVALDELNGTTDYAGEYSAENKAFFDERIERCLAQIDLPNKDEAFLRNRLLTMYANPAVNYLATRQK